ncbi:MAG: hypothetical protein IJO05_06410 [Oscillospiraceae bacterium]|nr:hypothetical protein [Oscillospiraceae bacterium]
MKRIVCMLTILCLLLTACGGAPVETTAPAETTLPTEATPPTQTTAPPVDHDMSYQEEDLPIPENPAETVPPVETTEPVFREYTVRIEDPETPIYCGAAFVFDAVALIDEAGAYTIVEESTDADGNLWGRLKSGLGWVCLTDPPLAPIHADYAAEDFNAFHAYWSDETDYITAIGFTPAEKLTNVEFGLLDWFETESWQMAEVLYTMDELDPDHSFLAQVVFWGDMTTYGISFTDADGAERHYAVSISGRDGSLVCSEYIP